MSRLRAGGLGSGSRRRRALPRGAIALALSNRLGDRAARTEASAQVGKTNPMTR
jgi:hypothetical protein